jgi:dephospho-CoA kinase
MLLSDKENEIVGLIRDKRYEQAHEELSKFINTDPLPPVHIALIGKLRSGKSEIATYLFMQHGINDIAFADSLKRVIIDLYGHSDHKPRERLQAIGEALCEYDPEVFVNAALRTAMHYDRVCVSDCRKQVEYSALKDDGYMFIRVTASDELRLQRAREAGDEFTVADLQHTTETQLDDAPVDYTIENDGSIEDLYAKVDVILADIQRSSSSATCATS